MTVYPNLDEKIPINLFSGPKKRNSKSPSRIMCAHVGSLVWDGFNGVDPENDYMVY